ncbi:MAG: DUF1080 domain-containing protein [Pirellulaceae bacterium]
MQAMRTLTALSLVLIAGTEAVIAQETPARPATPADAKTADPNTWRAMFDGKSLDGWKSTNFGGEGDVSVVDGNLTLDFGSSLTGATYTRDFPRTNYEVRAEAQRVDGRDFFCGMTFPVEKAYCSWIVGGWGGAVVGLSSIDGLDASENDTTKFMKFENERWYRFRLRVEPHRIQAWIDDQRVIDQNITGRKISTRSEVVLSQPFGFAAWETKAAIRNIAFRTLSPQEQDAP